MGPQAIDSDFIGHSHIGLFESQHDLPAVMRLMRDEIRHEARDFAAEQSNLGVASEHLPNVYFDRLTGFS